MNNKLFLIDTENINRRFIPGLETLDNTDRVILFYSDEEQLTMEVLTALATTKATIEKHLVKQHSKNAMDFQICTYLGMLVQQYGKQFDYYIVSLDNGYKAAVEFIKTMHIEISLEIVKNCLCQKVEEEVRASIDELLSSFSRKVRKEAEEAIKRTHNTAELHNYLQANLRTDGKTVYQAIKPFYHQLKTA